MKITKSLLISIVLWITVFVSAAFLKHSFGVFSNSFWSNLTAFIIHLLPVIIALIFSIYLYNKKMDSLNSFIYGFLFLFSTAVMASILFAYSEGTHISGNYPFWYNILNSVIWILLIGVCAGLCGGLFTTIMVSILKYFNNRKSGHSF